MKTFFMMNTEDQKKYCDLLIQAAEQMLLFCQKDGLHESEKLLIEQELTEIFFDERDLREKYSKKAKVLKKAS
jgi:hypothetical protein